MRLISIFILAFVLLNCKDDKVKPLTCDVADPATELPWLKAKIDQIKASQWSDQQAVYLVQHGMDQLFTIQICCPNCSWVPQYFDCAGNEVVITDKLAINRIRDIWIPENYQCAWY